MKELFGWQKGLIFIPENKYTKEDLKTMQSWSLQRKIQVTQTRIFEWDIKNKGDIYISFSGGKDSTVLLDLARRVRPDIEAVFVDTGLEYPEIRDFVKTKENITWIHPEKYNRKSKKYERLNFKEVIEKWGYPIISKQVSNSIARFKINPNEKWRYDKFINGINKDGSKTQFAIPKKWQDVALNAPFKVSDNCCSVIKHRPCLKYEKETNRKPIIAMMADDDKKREREYKKTGCNAFELKRPMSNPMGFWTEQDVLQYIKLTKIPYCKVYGNIVVDERGLLKTTGEERTGCMFCCFGVHHQKEPNRFQRMKTTHPKQYDYCMRPVEENGLGMGTILDFINVKYQ